MSRRTKSRQAAIQILFQDDFNPDHSRDQDRKYLVEHLGDDLELIDLAWLMIDGVRQKTAKIDAMVDEATDNWNLNRISSIEHNIIRLSIFEAKYFGTPVAVSIDEAIRSAKKFGGKESPRFVNGVLDRILCTSKDSVPKSQAGESDNVQEDGSAKVAQDPSDQISEDDQQDAAEELSSQSLQGVQLPKETKFVPSSLSGSARLLSIQKKLANKKTSSAKDGS